MLVLSRRVNERIIIGESIVLTVIECRGDKCRIGISAPPEIAINRGELVEQMEREASNGPAPTTS